MDDIELPTVACPWCGAPTQLHLSEPGLAEQLIEDCEVCCQPMVAQVTWDEDASASVTVTRE